MMKYRKQIIISMLLIISISLYACGEDDSENNSISNLMTSIQEEPTTQKKTEPVQTTEEPEVLKVQDVVGKSLDNAKLVLESQGFKVEISEEFSDDVKEGCVISQIPSADNDLSLSKGDVIKLTVSKGKEKKVAKYLDSIIYADYVSPCPYNTMSAYSGKDLYGNECARAIKFECDVNAGKYDKDAELEQSVKVTYLVDKDIKSFLAILAPVEFGNNVEYLHVNLYKDDELIYSMDVSKDTKPMEMSYDIEDAGTFSIELKYLLSGEPWAGKGCIVFSEARFE